MIISAAVAIAEARMGKPGEKYYSGRSRAIMERAYIAFKSSTWMIVFSGFVEPVLFLLSFGYGLKDLLEISLWQVSQLGMWHLLLPHC